MIRTLTLLSLVLSVACAGSQQTPTNTDTGSMAPLAGEIDDLALLPSHLAAGEEPAESLNVEDYDRDSLVVEGLENVQALNPLAVTASIEMLVVAEGQRIPLRLRLMSYENGLHVYGVEMMTAYDAEGRACTAADEAAKFLVNEAREGRWSTMLLDPDSIGTELPSAVRMTLIEGADDMYTDVIAIGDALASARLLEARMGDEVVVYSRDSEDLGLFQSVIRIDPNANGLRVLGPPHVRVSRIDPSNAGTLTAAK